MSQGDSGTTQFNLNATPFTPGAARASAALGGTRSTREFNPDAAPFTPSSALSGPTDSSSFSSPGVPLADAKSIPLLEGFRSKRPVSVSADSGAAGSPTTLPNGSYNSPPTAPVPAVSASNRGGGPVADAPQSRGMPMSWVPPHQRKQASMRTPHSSTATPDRNPVTAAATSGGATLQQATAPAASTLAVPMPRTAYAQLANATAAANASNDAITMAPQTAELHTAWAPPAPRSRPNMYPSNASSRTPAPRSQTVAAAASAAQSSGSSPPDGATSTLDQPARPTPSSPPPVTSSVTNSAPRNQNGEFSAASVSAHPGGVRPADSAAASAVHPVAESTEPAPGAATAAALRAAPLAAPPAKMWMPPQRLQMERLKMMRQPHHEDPETQSPAPAAASSQPAQDGSQQHATQSQPPAALAHRPPPAPRSMDPTASSAQAAQQPPHNPSGAPQHDAPVTVSTALPPRTGSAPIVKSFSLPDPMSRIRRNLAAASGLPSRPPAETSAAREDAQRAPASAAPQPQPQPQQTRSPPRTQETVPSGAFTEPQPVGGPAYAQVPTPPPPQPAHAGAAAAPSAVAPQQARPGVPPPTLLRTSTTAAPYTPKNWVPPPQRRLAAVTPVRPSPTTPLVVLILGNRGSGKTTQGEALAARYNLLHLSSGNIFRESKQPYEVLEEVVRKHFVDPSRCPYNGLVLDRFIASSSADAFFVQHALNIARLPVPLVFWLKVDPAVGLQRAAAAASPKQGHDHWRLVEQCAQAAVVHEIYEPIGCVHTIDTETLTQEQVTATIVDLVEAYFPRRRLVRQTLPSISPIPADENVTIMDKHSTFLQLIRHIHESVGSRGRHDSAPLSAIGGYVDETFFTDTANKVLRSYFVTPKIDGQRFLVVKHRDYAFVGVPSLFKSCFNFNSLFDGLVFSDPPPDQQWKPVSKDNPIEVVLDTELTIDANGAPTIHVIDYIYFYGNIAARQMFPQRLGLLDQWFATMQRQSSPEALSRMSVVLKQYAPIYDLEKLLPTLDHPRFKIDGVVFQNSRKYTYGPDKLLLKWKPQNQCTADFRLANGEDLGNGTWRFDLCVTDPGERQMMDEGVYEGASAIFTDEEKAIHHLQNAVVVELSLEVLDRETGASQWGFSRVRADKPSPNKHAIVRYILSLKHMTYQELAAHCAAVQ